VNLTIRRLFPQTGDRAALHKYGSRSEPDPVRQTPDLASKPGRTV
jgi:hypothetical protein